MCRHATCLLLLLAPVVCPCSPPLVAPLLLLLLLLLLQACFSGGAMKFMDDHRLSYWNKLESWCVALLAR
jgi:hypothetical protein